MAALQPDPDLVSKYRDKLTRLEPVSQMSFAAGALSAIVDQGAEQHANTCDGRGCTTCDFLRDAISLSIALTIEMGPPDADNWDDLRR
jgi:hypothetical protein